MIANLSGMDPAPTIRKDPAHAGLAGRHARAVRRRVVSLLPGPLQILNMTSGDDGLTRDLEARGSQVVTIEPDHPRDVTTPPDLGRTVLADFEQLPSLTNLESERFDAVVAIDRLGRVRDPESMLKAVREAIKPRGRMVLTVPDASHGRVRAALASGLDFYDESGPIDRGQLRLFTRDSLIATVEAAGFAVGQVEAIDASAFGDPTGINRRDASPEGWLVVAHALPDDDLRWIQSRVGEAARGRELAERRSAELESLHQEVLIMLDAAHSRARDLSSRLIAERGRLKDAHEQLMRRDEEHRNTCRELIDARDASEARRSADSAHTQALREALEAWHSRSEAEFEDSKKALVAARDAAYKQALIAAARCQDLEGRIEHILMKMPRRILGSFKRWVRSRGS